MRERRQYYRIDEDCRISYKKLSSARNFRQLSKDLSKKGIRFITREFLPVGSYIRLEVMLELTKRVIQMTGQVKWIRTVFDEEVFEVGVEFLEINHASNKYLSEYIKDHLQHRDDNS